MASVFAARRIAWAVSHTLEPPDEEALGELHATMLEHLRSSSYEFVDLAQRLEGVLETELDDLVAALAHDLLDLDLVDDQDPDQGWLELLRRASDLRASLETLVDSGETLLGEVRWVDSNRAEMASLVGRLLRGDAAAQRLIREVRAWSKAGAPRFGIERLTEDLDSAGTTLRQLLTHRWALTLGVLFTGPVEHLDAQLRGWFGLPAEQQYRDGLYHVHMRPPRGSTTHRWKHLMLTAREDGGEVHRRWVHKAVRGAVQDHEKGNRKLRSPLDKVDEAKVLALVDRLRAHGASERQVAVLRSTLVGESSGQIAKELHIEPSTVRVHLARARVRLRAMGEKTVAAALDV